MGHESGPCSDDFFYVSGRWHTWRNVVVKKDFQNEKIYGIIIITMSSDSVSPIVFGLVLFFYAQKTGGNKI